MKKPVTKLFSGILIGGMLLGGGAVMADTTNTGNSQSSSNPSAYGQRMPGMKQADSKIMQSVIAELVKDGTLTQTQADAITAKSTALDTARQAEMKKTKDMTQAERETYRQENKGEKTDLFAALVSDGTLTEKEVASIQTAMQEKMKTQQQEQIQTQLDALVQKNVITSKQSTAISAEIKQQETDRKAEMDKVKAMTEAERTAYFKDKQTSENVSPLAALVTDGTLTQAQADAILKVIPQGGGHRGPGGDAGHQFNGQKSSTETTK